MKKDERVERLKKPTFRFFLARLHCPKLLRQGKRTKKGKRSYNFCGGSRIKAGDSQKSPSRPEVETPSPPRASLFKT
jgi:hypothetical protein